VLYTSQGGRERTAPPRYRRWEKMSMNRTDSTVLRTRIRQLAGSISRALLVVAPLVSPDGVNSVQSAIGDTDMLLEVLSDYEAKLPAIIPSTRSTQADNLV